MSGVPATKAARLGLITELIRTRALRSQTELSTLLIAQGLSVTQATLSRDLEELGAVKIRGVDGGAAVYVIPEDGPPRPMEGGTARLEERVAAAEAAVGNGVRASAEDVTGVGDSGTRPSSPTALVRPKPAAPSRASR